MEDVIKLGRIQLVTIVLFFFSKAWLRPFILNGEFHSIFEIIVLSLPNFFEGIVGVLTLTYISLYINHRWNTNRKLHDASIYIIATILAAIYVITQEFKIHNLGGNNVYDPYDVLFSVVGLILGYIIVVRIEPSIKRN